MFPLAAEVLKGNREAAAKRPMYGAFGYSPCATCSVYISAPSDMDPVAGVTLVIESVLPASPSPPSPLCASHV